MVVVTVTAEGASIRLCRYDAAPPKTVKTHETLRPTANPEDIEGFRRSPQTHLRFGFRDGVEAKARGL